MTTANQGMSVEEIGQILAQRVANAIEAIAIYEKEQIKSLGVRALVMTIGLDLSRQILNAQTEAQKPENLKHKDVRGMIRKDILKEKFNSPVQK
ncbi:hypothetical protein Tco_0793154 [Tanacetum coccineum]